MSIIFCTFADKSAKQPKWDFAAQVSKELLLFSQSDNNLQR